MEIEKEVLNQIQFSIKEFFRRFVTEDLSRQAIEPLFQPADGIMAVIGYPLSFGDESSQ